MVPVLRWKILTASVNVERNHNNYDRTRLQAYKGDKLSQHGYREFSSAWHKTRFDSLSLEDFLISLMPNDFITKKEERARELRQRQSIHETLIDRHPNSYAATWLDALHSKELRLPQKELYLQEDILERVAQALEQLPENMNGCHYLPIEP